jgi:two-component sensor histidine kinase
LAETVRRQEERLRRKDMLIREVDHRVKNGFQALVSLLRMEAGRRRLEPVAEVLQRSCSRIEALAAVHDMLHAQRRADALDVGAYVRTVCASLGRVLGADGRERTLLVEVELLRLGPEAAQALALVVNELVTNAFRHAFAPGRPGPVRVTGRRTSRGGCRLSVADDGDGLPDGLDLGSGGGLGHRLVEMMAEQLGAEIEVSGHGGTCITLVLPSGRA